MSPLASFIAGFVLALVMVLIMGGIYAWAAAGKARKLTWVERRLGIWHKRRSKRAKTKPPGQPDEQLTGKDSGPENRTPNVGL